MKVQTPNEDGAFRIALYARVSTEAQAEEGYSIDIQKAKLLAYSQTLSFNPESLEYYVDDGYSGGNLDRPRMKDLISDIEDGLITHVIVYKLDRLSRSQKDTLQLIEDVFIPNNVAFISVQESFDTSTPFGRAVVGILSVFAQFERENIYERTRSGMRKRVEDGYWMGGGVVPFGYDYDSTQGILVPNKDAEIVKQLYDLYLQGYSEEMLAKKFNLKYDKLVHHILTRKSNTGVIIYKGNEYQGRHEPLVSLETYNATMSLMKQRSERKLVTKTDHLLTGLFECGVCGAKMRYSKYGQDYFKITCYSQQKSKKYLVKDPDCNNGKTDAQELEKIVLNDIFSMTDNLDVKNDALAPNKSVIDTIEDQQRILENKLKRLYTLYAEDENDYLLDTINTLKKELSAVKERLKQEQDAANLHKTVVDKQKELKNLRDAWDYMTHQEKQNAVRSLVDKIIINNDSIEIKYKL